MKQKLRNLSAQANIIFAILAVFIFIAPLQWSGKVLGLIPGMEKADDYLLQAMVETVVLVIFLGITYLFGLWDIFKENAAGWTRSLYTGGFFIVYRPPKPGLSFERTRGFSSPKAPAGPAVLQSRIISYI